MARYSLGQRKWQLWYLIQRKRIPGLICAAEGETDGLSCLSVDPVVETGPEEKDVLMSSEPKDTKRTKTWKILSMWNNENVMKKHVLELEMEKFHRCKTL